MTLNAEPDWSSTKSSGARFHEHDSLLIASSTIAPRERRESERERERERELRVYTEPAVMYVGQRLCFRLGERRIESLLTIALFVLDIHELVALPRHFKSSISRRSRSKSAFSSPDAQF